MDYIRAFDVELDRQVYYAGEMLSGHVYLEVEENMRLQNIKVFLRGKAHAEWKITRAGERRTMKQDEHYIDERLLLWGKEDNDPEQGIIIMTRGRHRYPFHFQLPETALPCSFESKIGTIRYYVRVHVNIPYASCPQGIRYFTIVGPHIDCMDERFLTPVQASAKRNSCSLCCGKGPLLLRASLERTSYVCGEQIKLKAEVQNGSDSEVWVMCKLIQYVEFFINKGVLGLSKEVRHTVLEVESDKVPAHDTSRLDELMSRLVVPVMPPTMIEVCGLVQVYYTLKLYLETSKGKGDAAEISMPITIATVPFRIPNCPTTDIHYEVAAPNVEGGMYISTEFQLGQVYMGEEVDPETDQTILYQPVYVCVSRERLASRSETHLLQVPSRQTGRSRENVRGSREGLHQHQEGETGDSGQACSSGKISKPEDKFLQEITAKIANRQVKCQINEDGSKTGSIDLPQCEIEAQVEILKKQKNSNDFVHKALVNELRRHLSEGEEATEQDMAAGMKKVHGLRKVEPSKRMKTGEAEVEAHSPPWKSSDNEPMLPHNIRERVEEKVRATDTEHGSPSHKFDFSPQKTARVDQCYQEAKEGDSDMEYNEHTALLKGNSNENLQMEVGINDNVKVPMQHTMDTTPQEEPESHSHHSSSTQAVSAVIEEKISDTELLMKETADDTTLNVMACSAEHTIDNITSLGNDNTTDPDNAVKNAASSEEVSSLVVDAPPYVPPPEPKLCSPKVAPKPRQKERQSYPAAQPASGMVPSGESISELTVHVLGRRPKSEMVEEPKRNQDSYDSQV